MTKVMITTRVLGKLKPTAKAFFVRDKLIRGFGVKVNPSGSIKFIVDVWNCGHSYRIDHFGRFIDAVFRAASQAL